MDGGNIAIISAGKKSGSNIGILTHVKEKGE
jgi:hypothetical protein